MTALSRTEAVIAGGATGAAGALGILVAGPKAGPAAGWLIQHHPWAFAGAVAVILTGLMVAVAVALTDGRDRAPKPLSARARLLRRAREAVRDLPSPLPLVPTTAGLRDLYTRQVAERAQQDETTEDTAPMGRVA